MTTKFITGLLLLGFLPLYGQTKKARVEIQDEIVWAGVDRPGDLFVVLKSGQIQKFDNQGVQLGKYIFPMIPTSFEAGDGTQSFYYLRTGNQYGFLSPEMELLTQKTIDPAFAVSPWLVCSSFHDVWIMDIGDFSIKKTKWNATAISLEVPMKVISKTKEDYTLMREYQNYLFILDKKAGVHLFSSLGRLIRTLGEKDMDNFNFLGEELYYIKGDEMILIDLYTEEKRKIKLPQPCKMALVTDTTLFAIEENGISIYDFKP